VTVLAGRFFRRYQIAFGGSSVCWYRSVQCGWRTLAGSENDSSPRTLLSDYSQCLTATVGRSRTGGHMVPCGREWSPRSRARRVQNWLATFGESKGSTISCNRRHFDRIG